MALTIKPAQKIKQFARVCLWGPPKAGKSHTALALAQVLAGEDGKVGVISSEYGSTKLLAHKFSHDIIDLAEPDEMGNMVKNPFAPARYEDALKLFLQNDYKVVVIDSLSHAWAGEGGVLEIVESVGKNSFNDGWGKGTPAYNHLINSILAARCHIIVTLRAKDKYIQDEYIKSNGTKGSAPRNVGEAPVMRKGFAFEMQVTMRMDSMIGYIEASAAEDYIHKGEEIEKPGEELAYRLLDALDGVEIPEPSPQEQLIAQLLSDFQNLYPTWCAKTAGWQQSVMRKALEIPDGQALPKPVDYNDEHIGAVANYIELKRQEKQKKAS